MFTKRTQPTTLSATSSTSRHSRTPFDFGHGPVRAARHTNPDGTIGGWVADSAHVDETAHVDTGARVFGNARVFGTAEILDSAQVYDTARIGDGAVIRDRAKVSGAANVSDATISGRARVNGTAQVSHGAEVTESAKVTDEAKVRAGRVAGEVVVKDQAWVTGARIDGQVVIAGTTVVRAEQPATATEPLAAATIDLAEIEHDVDLTDTVEALAALTLDPEDASILV